MKFPDVIKKSKDLCSSAFSDKKKRTLIIIGILIIVFGVSFVIKKSSGSKMQDFEKLISNDVVMRGNVEETITGSGTVEPYERYEIISLVSGDILASPFEVGDQVTKDDLLYEIDKSSISLSIERQQLSLEQSRNSYNNALEEADKLKVRAACSGIVSGLDLKVGNKVQNSTVIATIENTYDMEVVLPFNELQISNINIGDNATVTSSQYMSYISGKVTHIEKNPTAQADGNLFYGVTIEFKNPGALTQGLVVGGAVNGMISPGSGSIKSGDLRKITPEISGEVEKIHVANGDYVKEGDVLVTLSSDSVENSIKSSNLQYRSSDISLQETMDTLENYSLTSPINGTVITKNKKAGDTIDRNSNSQTLMVVADISKLKFVLNVDELDISKVEVGQDVKISCDALVGEQYMGKITNVSVEGISTNGVTVYEAEVVIDEPGNLRPSMNIDATVVFASSENTLIVPSGDIKTVMGKSYVFKKEADDKKTDEKKEKPEDNMPVKEESFDIPSGDKMANGKKSMDDMPQNMMPEAPEGYVTVEITTGLSNDEYTEVLSGLSEGDEIYRISNSSSSGGFGMMGAMGGGMPGGAMGGGMPGGSMPARSGGGMGGMR